MENKGLENLIPFDKLTEEEQRAIRSAGGKASGKARRKKKELKKLLELALSQPMQSNPNEDNYTGITAALIAKALAGDTKAFEVIRDTIGQKPVEVIDATVSSNDIKITIEE